MPKPSNRGIRGIRHPVPSGTLIGRQVNAGTGAPGYITFFELAQYIAGMSGVLPTQLPVINNFMMTHTAKGNGSVMLISGVTQRVLNLVVPAGTWDFSANVVFDPTAASLSTFSDALAAISLDPSIVPAKPNGGGYVEHAGVLSVTKATTLTTAVMRVVLPSTAPVWLLAQATFS